MPAYLLPTVIAYNRLMANSFQRFTGESILGATNAAILTDAELAQAVFDAPQAIVSHGTEADPIFRYANARALRLWEMDWEAFIRLPSRLSAEVASDIQSDRNALLKAALARGWVDDYTGIRIASTGQRFHIRNTTLWNVVDSQGVHHGQAAFIRDWRFL
ncbi:MEKHLA domain-containing protein [Asticcacaulis sp.]|uniref:MEKHLA domain-containing protein n=1 Tax=Asticcacaulis sp. TaxID=1872648 RepID=UPI003F7BBDD9